MLLAHQVLVLVHLVGFAALLGGVLAQARTPEPEVTGAMLWGGWAELVTGAALLVLQVLGPAALLWWPLVVKLALTAFVVLLLARNRRFLSIPRGLLGLIGALSLAAAALALVGPTR